MELSTFSILAGITVAVAVYYFFVKKKTHYWLDKNVPFEGPHGFFSTTWKGLRERKMYWEIDQEWCRKNGRIFGCYQLGQPMLYLTDPEAIRKTFVKDFHIFPDRRQFDMMDPIANNFITVLTGEDWKRVRSVITPAFSTGKLKKMVKLMDDCAESTVDNLLKVADENGFLDCKAQFGGFTLDIIANTAFGTKLNSSRDPDNIFVQHARQTFNVNFPWRLVMIILVPSLSRLLGIRAFKPSVMEFFVNLTNTVVERRKASKEDRGDFLQNLLEAQMRNEHATEPLTELDHPEEDAPSEECQSFLKQYSKNKTISNEEFVAACVLFFLAGYDTTATTLAMTAYYLALNPECQKRVTEEVDEVLKNYPEIDYEALSKLKYLDAAISETLRLVPPAPRLERKAVEDYTLDEADVTIPKGMMVGVPIYAMHMDPEFFPNPEKYDPERFLPENKDQIKPYTYMPFGAGPRNCLGMRFALMEIKLCLLRVFQLVTFEPCPQTKIPPELYKGSGLYQPKTVNLKVLKRSEKL